MWEGKQLTPQIVMDLSAKMISDWQKAQHQEIRDTGGQGQEKMVRKWQAPQIGWYKVNVDASIHEGSSSFKVGMIMRNNKGEFIAGANRCIEGNVSVLEAETTGVYEALQWIEAMEVQNVVVETDSLTVANGLRKQTRYYSEVGIVLDGCHEILRRRLDVRIQHVRRQANSVAHHIAKLPCLLGTMNSFVSPPSCVLEVLLADGFCA